jgi:SOS-response transcriptional repressor LexA
MLPLTPKQLETKNYIRDYIKEHGYPPRQKDVMHGLGMNSPAVAAHFINELMKKGHLQRTRCARSIVLMEGSSS